MINAKAYVDLIRRSTHSGYSTLIMNNRLLLQCYNLAIDSDNGFHYILFVPDTEEYNDPFYDIGMVIEPKQILAAYNAGHTKLLTEKKEVGAKPKEVSEELYFTDNENGSGTITFSFYVKEILVATESCTVITPLDPRDINVANIEDSYNGLIDKISIGGCGIVLDGKLRGIQKKTFETPGILYYPVTYHKKNIRIPFMRSMFNGIKDVDELTISVQDTILKDIYLYSINFVKKGIAEQFWGYIQNF